MKTSVGAGGLLFGALILGACGAAPVQGAQLRVHATTAASIQYVAPRSQLAAPTRSQPRQTSPAMRACKGGSSKSCGELGDRLTIKHAYAEAHRWYVIACDRVSGAMLPTGERMLRLSQELTAATSRHSEDEAENDANRRRVAELKGDASELKARLQGCFDAGETLKMNADDLRQALKFYDTVCEFSGLVASAGEAVPGLEHLTESGCSAGQSARAQLSSKSTFEPSVFNELLQPGASAAKQPAQPDQGMVFSEGDVR